MKFLRFCKFPGIFQWFPNAEGFMTSFCIAGYGFGGAIWNPVETAFVNPTMSVMKRRLERTTSKTKAWRCYCQL